MNGNHGHPVIPIKEAPQDQRKQMMQYNSQKKVLQYDGANKVLANFNGKTYATLGEEDLPDQTNRLSQVKFIDGKVVDINGVLHYGVDCRSGKDDLKSIEKRIKEIDTGVVVSNAGSYKKMDKKRVENIGELIDKYGASSHTAGRKSNFEKLGAGSYGMTSCNDPREPHGTFIVVRTDEFEYVYRASAENLEEIANSIKPGNYSVDNSIIAQQSEEYQEMESTASQKKKKDESEKKETAESAKNNEFQMEINRHAQDYMRENNIDHLKPEEIEDFHKYITIKDPELAKKIMAVEKAMEAQAKQKAQNN